MKRFSKPTPTMQLRWVRRGGEKILQQKHRQQYIKTDDNGKQWTGADVVWLDIPVEEPS